jgi:signal transduction histidine kinase
VTRRLLICASGCGALVACAGVVVARWGDNAATTYAGTSWAAALAMLAAALALFAASALARARRAAALALAAGICWLAPIAAAWPSAPGVPRAIATIAAAFTFPLLVHLALGAPDARLEGRTAGGVVAAAYGWAAFAAVTLALVRDPFYDPHCWSDCDGNALLVRSSPGLSDALVEARPWVQLLLGAAVAALGVRRLARPVLASRLSGGAALGVGVVAILHARRVLEVPFEDPLDPTLRGLFFAACAASVLVAAALVAPLAQALLRRRAVRQVVAALDAAPAPDELEQRLGEALRDPTLRIVFRLPEVGRTVDATGAACEPPASRPRRAVTPLARCGELVAWVEHDAGVAGSVEPALTPAVRLSVDNARLRAGLLAQMRDLRDARRRIVADGDDERRRLERDLHDGVQQQLLALGAELRVAAAAARASGHAAERALDRAVGETAAVLEEVRVVAHGIYPAILTDAGLAPGIASLADVAALPVEIVGAPDRRYSAPVEAAAYRVVAEGIENAVSYSGARVVEVEVGETGGALHVRVHDDGRGGARVTQLGGLAELVDRVGAIDGTVSIESGAEGTAIGAVIPCGS